jgi:FkbM family methyltransferase
MKALIKGAYNAVPLKKELFSLVKNFWHPREDVYKHLHFHGVFEVPVEKDISFLLNHHGFVVENEIFWEGLEKGHESVSYSLWKKLAKDSRVIFDIGANTGVYSLIAKSLNPTSEVYAFEPVKRVFQKLEGNKKLNSFDISCFEEALSNSDGEATIFDTAAEHTYSVTVNKNTTAANAEVIPTKIKIARLDTVIEKFGIKHIDLMKIDVETHEPEVLEGMGRYLKEFNPSILIEILDDAVGEKVEALVKENGYLYFNIDDKAKKLRKVEHITQSDFWNYLLCSPSKAKELELV